MQQYLYFGIKDVRGLTTELVANSSDDSLPDPSTNGSNNLEDVLANLKYTNSLAQEDLSLQQVSQILWAGYGCTPHTGTYSRAALTVPSWSAEYFLTRRIYVVKQDGVFRYHNRLPPGTDLSTRDHRIEKINETDVRSDLRSAVSRLPQQAPCYIIICLDSGDADKWYARLETGFVAGNMLMQASALDMGSYFTTKLTEEEKRDIQNVTGIPALDIPHAIVSIGKVATSKIFDTGSPANPYPSIRGTHNGTLIPIITIEVSKLYTYPCTGTGGHTEHIRIYNESGTVAEANWTGYKGDWHTITFAEQFTLEEGKTYNYTIRTGSYPQMIHKQNHTTLDGSSITCEEFIDANGKKYNDWIPAIRLE